MQAMLISVVAFMLVVALSLGLLYLGRNSLRKKPEKLLHLIRQARSGQLQEKAWTYGLAQPFYHAPEVDDIREELLKLERDHWVGGRRFDHHKKDFLLDDTGMQELERIEFRLHRILAKRQDEGLS